MRNWLWSMLLLAVGASAGYLAARLQAPKFVAAVPNLPMRNAELACKSEVNATLFEHLLTDEVHASAGKGSDEAALKIDKEEITFLTGAGVRLGVTQGEKYPIVRRSGNQILAAKIEDPQGILHGFIINRDTGRVLWVKLTGAPISSGQAIHFHCY